MEKRIKEATGSVQALAIFFILCATIAFFVVGLAAITSYGLNETAATRSYDMLIAFVMCIIFSISGRGLLLHKKWARLVGIFVSTISVIRLGWKIVYALKGNGHDDPTMLFIIALIFIIVIFYLTRPKVKEQFK